MLATAVIAHVLGVEPGELGTTTFRPPYTPISFAALAGRERGDLYDPVRTTGAHAVGTSARGAEFENVGQWKRPWFYPAPGEDMHAAVARECAAARTNVAFMDGSTLGKIDVQGPDAPAFLDMLYTNLMSSLKVGMIRYGVMCGPGRHGHRRRHRLPPLPRALPGHHHHRQRREDPGLDGGVAADRMAPDACLVLPR